MKYYSCEYLLSLKDANGELPEIYISDGNRTAGKSFSWKTTLINRFLKKPIGNQFIILFRNKYEIKDCATPFFEDVRRVKYLGHEMTSKKICDGIMERIYLDGIECGFAVPLSMATKIKRLSALFSEVGAMFFDEYQDDNNRYLPKEVEKLQSIHTSVARGDGKQHRRVPLYMASNAVSILNPYYDAFGISKRLRNDTKFLRGNGWVYERTFNESAKESFQSAGFNKAFSDTSYYKHASENLYLNDNQALLESPSGLSKYQLSVKYNGEWYSIRKYDEIMYVDEGYDSSYPVRICFNVNDVTDDRQIMVGRSHYMVLTMREWFSNGRMRFRNLKCKDMILDLLAFI